MAGIVHFSRFFVFMESAEHEFLRSLGTSVTTEWNADIISWPRLAASCEYLNPAKFEDVLNIHLTVRRKGVKSLTYQFDFAKGDVENRSGRIVRCVLYLQPRRKGARHPDTGLYR